MIEHERTHRDDFKFKCPKCSRGFFREKQLTDHKCRPEKEGEEQVRQPELFRRKSKRKVGRPRKRMITVTEETLKENVKRMATRGRGRSLRGMPVVTPGAGRVNISEQLPGLDTQQQNSVPMSDGGVPTQQHQHQLQPQQHQIQQQQQQQEQQQQEAEQYQLVQHSVEDTISRLGTTTDPEQVSMTPITVNMDSAFQTATIPVCSVNGEMPKEICVQIRPLHGPLVQTQGLDDGSEVTTAQVISIEPADFGTDTVNLNHAQIMTSHGHFGGQMETLHGNCSDVGTIGTATLIATGPNMATLVVNTRSGEILAGDSTAPLVANGSQTVSYVTAEQLESLQANAAAHGTMFGGTETILQASTEMLREPDQ